MAGINNSPYSYNPFIEKDTSEKIEKRTKTFLNKMLELGYIEQEDFENAISEVTTGLVFEKGSFDKDNSNLNSFNFSEIVTHVIEDFANKNLIPKEFAYNYFALSNSKIYFDENNQVQW